MIGDLQRRLTLSKPFTDLALQKAIELRASPVFGALSMANALGGSGHADEWDAVREFTFVQLVDEAKARELPIALFMASCDDRERRVIDTPIWRAYRKIASDLKFTTDDATPENIYALGERIANATMFESDDFRSDDPRARHKALLLCFRAMHEPQTFTHSVRAVVALLNEEFLRANPI